VNGERPRMGCATSTKRAVRNSCDLIVEININENSVTRRPTELQNPGEPLLLSAAGMVGSTIKLEQREILKRRWTRQDRMFEPD
jgi:hypothetical protein